MSDLDAHARPAQERLAAIATNGFVTADEVLFLRRTVFADGVVTADELDLMFDLADRAPEGDAEWPQYFAEIVADYYLREEEPQGYLTDEEFASLQARVTRDGYANALERLLLVKLMETAVKTPAIMSAFTGAQIKAAIIARNAPAVDRTDIMLIRRWLFAAGGDGHVGVTRNEAEILFDINDAIRASGPNEAWTELFTTGIVNHLMASLGYTAADREEAMRQHAFISDHAPEVGGFFRKMAAGVFDAFRNAGRAEKTVYQQKEEARAVLGATAEEITPEEAGWLATRIGRDGTFDEAERAIVNRMKELKADLPEDLKALVDRAA